MSSQAFIREIEVSDRDAGKYFEFLEELFGIDALEDRLKRLEKEISQERGAYLRYWVIPKSSFWLGIKEGRRLIQTKIPLLFYTRD